MSPRDDDIAKLAGLLSWAVAHSPTGRYFYRHDGDGIDIPAPDAPLPEALAFVGHLAVALGVRIGRVSDDLAWEEWTVVFRVQIGHSEGGAEYEDAEGTAPDLAWAACRAAIAARKGGTNGHS